MRHLNVSLSSIYVQQDGTWKLFGFEHLWSAKELTPEVLKVSQPYRYKSSIDPNEVKNVNVGLEQYAFATLCEEVLKNIESEFGRNRSCDLACTSNCDLNHFRYNATHSRTAAILCHSSKARKSRNATETVGCFIASLFQSRVCADSFIPY